MTDVLLTAYLTALADDDRDTAREVVSMADDPEAVDALLADDGYAESYTPDEHALLSEAARAGLVLKQVGTHPKTGEPVMRWVKGGGDVGGGKPKAVTVADADGEPITVSHPRAVSIAKKLQAAQTAGDGEAAMALGVILSGVEGSDSLPDAGHRRLVGRRAVAVYADAERLGKSPAAKAAEEVLSADVGADPVGEAGAVVPFNPIHHDADTAASTGQTVRVTRSGWTMTEGGGTEYVLLKAKVKA